MISEEKTIKVKILDGVSMVSVGAQRLKPGDIGEIPERAFQPKYMRKISDIKVATETGLKGSVDITPLPPIEEPPADEEPPTEETFPKKTVSEEKNLPDKKTPAKKK